MKIALPHPMRNFSPSWKNLGSLAGGALLAVHLCSCSMITDAVELERRANSVLSKGTVLTGDGFTVAVPENNLAPRLNFPAKGGVTLQAPEPFSGVAYFVAPYVFPQARNPEEALATLNRERARRGTEFIVTDQKRTTFAGLPAVQALIQVRPPRGGMENVAAILVVQRSTDFLILCRGNYYHREITTGDKFKASRTGLQELMKGTKLTRR